MKFRSVFIIVANGSKASYRTAEVDFSELLILYVTHVA